MLVEGNARTPIRVVLGFRRELGLVVGLWGMFFLGTTVIPAQAERVDGGYSQSNDVARYLSKLAIIAAMSVTHAPTITTMSMLNWFSTRLLISLNRLFISVRSPLTAYCISARSPSRD